MDEHFERLRERVLTALRQNEIGSLPDSDLIFVMESTCNVLERSHEAARRELWAASADFEEAMYALPISEVGTNGRAEEAFRATRKAAARERARSALAGQYGHSASGGNDDQPVAVDASERASRFYSVEMTSEKIGRLRSSWRAVSLVLLGILLMSPSDRTKLRTAVTVVRTVDGSIAQRFDYYSPVEAAPHLDSLRDRLTSMTKSEFEESVGIIR